MIEVKNVKISMDKKEITAIAQALQANAEALKELAKAANSTAPSYGMYFQGTN